MKTFLGLTAHSWWMLDTVLLLLALTLQWRHYHPSFDPQRGFEPTSSFDFDDWCAVEPQDDPWDVVLFEKEPSDGVQKC